MKTTTTLLLFGLLVFLFACKKDQPQPELAPNPLYSLEHNGLPDPQIPQDNRLTKEGVQLGRKLFYEKKLSRDASISCASCHVQENAFSDINRFSTGVRGLEGTRQSMAVFNMAWNDNEFFWDGRAHLLRDQVIMPIQDTLEMDETLEAVIGKLEAEEEYRAHFRSVFGEDGIDEEKISLALEQFIHSIVSNRSKYDKFLAGQVSLTEEEERGRQLYFTNFDQENPEAPFSNCNICHVGPNFENDSYMNNGLDTDDEISDPGRFNVTGGAFQFGAFKVPTLRNIELTAPYMHDGRFETLEEVIDHYSEGIVQSATVNPTLLSTAAHAPLFSAEQKADLIAFLKTLTDHEMVNDARYSDPF